MTPISPQINADQKIDLDFILVIRAEIRVIRVRFFGRSSHPRGEPG
jgi:hypothetical protein